MTRPGSSRSARHIVRMQRPVTLETRCLRVCCCLCEVLVAKRVDSCSFSSTPWSKGSAVSKQAYPHLPYSVPSAQGVLDRPTRLTFGSLAQSASIRLAAAEWPPVRPSFVDRPISVVPRMFEFKRDPLLGSSDIRPRDLIEEELASISRSLPGEDRPWSRAVCSVACRKGGSPGQDHAGPTAWSLARPRKEE